MQIFTDKMLHFLEEQAPLIVIEFNGRGIAEKANSHSRNLIGRQVGGLHLSEIFVDFDNQLSLDNLTREGNQAQLLNISVPGHSPQTHWFHFYRKGDQVLCLGYPDTDNYQLLQQNLKEISAELSNANRELNSRNAELGVLNEQKNRLLGIAAHDLRTPIGHVLSCCSYLMDTIDHCLKQQELEFLEIIQDSSRLMLAIIDDILDLSAIEAGELNLKLVEEDLLTLLRKNVEVNQLLASRRKVTLVLEEHPGQAGLPGIFLDRPKINQVLNNLISNAIKYSPEDGYVVVSVDADEREVLIKVMDQGPGFPTQEMDVLFKPFGKTSFRPTGKEKSTGLGLSIAHRIIAGHGGRIWAENRTPTGAIFEFTLPLNKQGAVP